MWKLNGLKLFLGIIVLCFCSFLVSCKTEADDPSHQKKITITGIPSTHNYRYGISSFGNAYNGNILAISDTIAINNGTVTMGMYDYNASAYSKEFTESGNYIVLFLITNYSGTRLYWRGGIGSMNISQETTSISFNSLIEVPLSTNISPSSLNMENIFPNIIENLGKDMLKE